MRTHRVATIALALASLGGSTARAADALQYTVDKSTYSVPASLTGVPGDPDRGRVLAVGRKKGNCLACHQMPIPEESFHGRIGPPLNGVASRYDAGQLRLRVVNPKLVNPMTIMPAFYAIEGLHRVAKDFEGKTILSGQEIEDVVAYLETLKN
ncbi:MAG: sulfur oxidation c-type cytochrome SoxX [Gammaproteobacteria bacterium]